MSSYSSNLSDWANSLNADPDWVAALNSAFDEVGFTDEYINAASLRKNAHRRKAIKDNVWGMVEIDPVSAWLIDCPILQRLRYVKQLGVSYLTYPGAQHSRFEHSVGVLHVVNRLISAFLRNKENESGAHDDSPLRAASYPEASYEATVVRLAALLHDIGHIPFSHATETFFTQSDTFTKIGPYRTFDFLGEFHLYYRGIKSNRPTKAAREKKSLSEIFSAAVVLSKRFCSFLDRSCPYTFVGRTAEAVSCDIAALILGDPIPIPRYGVQAPTK